MMMRKLIAAILVCLCLGLSGCSTLNPVDVTLGFFDQQNTKGKVPVYERGESIYVSLSISNNDNDTIHFPNLGCSVITFPEPHEVHIISPSGVDLHNQYQAISSIVENCADLPLSPGAYDDMGITTVQNWGDFLEPGLYKLYVVLVDSSGKAHQSNNIKFRIANEPPDLDNDDIKLNIALMDDSTQVSTLTLELEFQNNSSDFYDFYYPQGQSDIGWINPTYLLLIYSDEGKYLHTYLTPHTSSPIYGVGSHFRVPPDSSKELDWSPDRLKTLEPGVYQLQVVYIFHTNYMSEGNVVEDKGKWPKSVGDWASETAFGVIKSNTITVTIASRQ